MKGSISQKTRSFFRVSVSWNIRNFFSGWIFLFFRTWAEKCRDLFWENIRNFLILELESFISWYVRNFFGWRIFLFFGGAPGSHKVYCYIANLYIFTTPLFIICQATHCIVLKVQCFYLRRSKGPFVLLSTRDKRIAITFHEDQRLNIGNIKKMLPS